MLSRTVIRDKNRFGPNRQKPVAYVVVALTLISAVYLLLPNPGPRIQTVKLTDEEIKAAVQELSPVDSQQTSELSTSNKADFGRTLFQDSSLAASGVACSSCHRIDAYFQSASGLNAEPPRDVPTLVGSGRNHWFGWDGYGDSLESASIHALESARQLGSTRLRVTKQVLKKYKANYESVFGPLPPALGNLNIENIPDDGTAAPQALTLPISVMARALETLGDTQQLKSALDAANASGRAPARELNEIASRIVPKPPISWIANYESLSPEIQSAADKITTDIGAALAAYLRGLSAVESPFDHFAKRLLTSSTLNDALADDFGAQELTGLKLFVGPGRCVLCHNGANFTDQLFHNLGLPSTGGHQVDLGRSLGVIRTQSDRMNCVQLSAEFTSASASESCREQPYLDATALNQIGAFKTPTLRNIARTAPYMHDGRSSSLLDAMAHIRAAAERPAVGVRDGALPDVTWTAEELNALVAFLNSLTSPIRDGALVLKSP